MKGRRVHGDSKILSHVTRKMVIETEKLEERVRFWAVVPESQSLEQRHRLGSWFINPSSVPEHSANHHITDIAGCLHHDISVRVRTVTYL